ncbi:helix-turn-helix transcriptional regulator [Vallitalea guaymasensis]|uniref:helix-turn-helix transcriptional regulator n=1 Tax=Vallitalea guaymasensis TaxID=1185412 RepID=UPI000DE3971C|nr:Xaa-His dipeptidase [Vallitalea guaymasensis]
MKKHEEVIRENIKAIELWIEQNKTEKEIAKDLGMAYSTFRRYKSQIPELKQAIANGKDAKNQEVEKALYKNAIGYNYYEQVATKVKNEVMAEDGKTILVKESVEINNVEKYKGPDLAAEKYILNNRKKTQWQEDPHKVTNDKKMLKLKEKEVNAKILELQEL